MMLRFRTKAVRSVAIAAAIGATTLLNGVGPAHADVTTVTGGAYGYFAHNVSLFGGAQPDIGPVPTVSLPAGGSSTPITASAPSGRVAYGPGILFTSGPIDVSTQGSTGPSGAVTSTAHITTVPTEFAAGEILYAGDIKSTCTATEAGTSGSTTILGPGDAGHTSATLRVSDGNPNVDGDEVYVDLPVSPPANTSINGTLESVGDTYTVVFNEQIINPDGSITVNAVHEYLHGPTLIGELTIGQVTCGVTAGPHISSADLSVQTTDNPDPVARNGTVTYTVAVANAGPDAASGVTLSSTLVGAQLVSVTPPAGDTCTVSKGKTKVVTCNFGTIAASGSDTVTIVAKAPRKSGSMSLKSTVSSSVTDPDSSNNTSTETTTIQ